MKDIFLKNISFQHDPWNRAFMKLFWSRLFRIFFQICSSRKGDNTAITVLDIILGPWYLSDGNRLNVLWLARFFNRLSLFFFRSLFLFLGKIISNRKLVGCNLRQLTLDCLSILRWFRMSFIISFSLGAAAAACSAWSFASWAARA